MAPMPKIASEANGPQAQLVYAADGDRQRLHHGGGHGVDAGKDVEHVFMDDHFVRHAGLRVERVTASAQAAAAGLAKFAGAAHWVTSSHTTLSPTRTRVTPGPTCATSAEISCPSGVQSSISRKKCRSVPHTPQARTRMRHHVRTQRDRRAIAQFDCETTLAVQSPHEAHSLEYCLNVCPKTDTFIISQACIFVKCVDKLTEYVALPLEYYQFIA